jgi:hypothetical protein
MGNQKKVSTKTMFSTSMAVFYNALGYFGNNKAEHGDQCANDAENRFRQVDHPVVLAGQGDDHSDNAVKQHPKEDDGQDKRGFYRSTGLP